MEADRSSNQDVFVFGWNERIRLESNIYGSFGVEIRRGIGSLDKEFGGWACLHIVERFVE